MHFDILVHKDPQNYTFTSLNVNRKKLHLNSQIFITLKNKQTQVFKTLYELFAAAKGTKP